jgi:AraC-like DNA-binding protein
MELRLPRDVDPHNTIVTDEVGPLRVLQAHLAPGETVRTARHIRSHDPEEYLVFVQSAGETLIEQEDQSGVLGAGDLMLLDLSRPIRMRYGARESVAISYPKSLSALPPGELQRMAGVRIPGGDGVVGLVSSLVRQLPRHLSNDGAGARAGTALLDVLQVGLATMLDRQAAVSHDARRRALLLECRSYIETHLADLELGPTQVAGAHHISLRYLHRLFEATDSGVAEYIRRRRLDRCRRDLLDPVLAGRSVAAVGARWAFLDPAHFSRAFKAAYGLPPATYRAEHSPDLVTRWSRSGHDSS